MGRTKLYKGELCSVENCVRNAEARGWCRLHYRRAWKYGSPTEVRTKGRKAFIGPKAAKVKPPKTIPICDAGGCIELALDRPNAKYCGPHHDISQRTKSRPRTVWKATDDERFWSKVVRLGEDDCWLWTGRFRKKKKGKKYGEFGYQSRVVGAHRYSFEIANNVTLDSHSPVHHTCGETLCVNPKHLQVITPQENTAEMLERRWYKERIAELEADVAELRTKVDNCVCKPEISLFRKTGSGM